MNRLSSLLAVLLVFIATQHGCYGQSPAAIAAVGVIANATQSAVRAVSEMVVDGIFSETLVSLYDTLSSKDRVRACASENPALSGFSEKVKSLAQLMTSTAHQAQQIQDQANEMKIKQGEVTQVASDVWIEIKELFTKQQEILLALDMFIKDSIMRRSEQIGHDIRDGNKGGWDIAKVKEELMKEMSDIKAIADSLSGPVKDVVGNVITQAIQHVWANQVVNALTKGPLQESLSQDSDIKSLYPLTQYAVSVGIGRIANARQAIMTTGLDTADEYSTFSDITVNQTAQIQDGVNNISATTPCGEIGLQVTEAVTRLTEIHSNMETNEMKTAEKLLDEIEPLEATVINEVMFAGENGVGGMKATLDEIVKSLPEESKRSSGLQEAAAALSLDVAPSITIDALQQKLVDIQPKIKTLLNSFNCYVKILEVIGALVQGCQSGAGSFESMYTQVTEQANIDNDQCKNDAMLQLPSKEEIQTTITTVAEKLKFNADCSSNKQNDEHVPQIRLQFQDAGIGSIFGSIFGIIKKVLTTTQRFLVCEMRQNSTSDAEIAKKIGKKEGDVKSTLCKKKRTPKEDL